jgi:LPPG:FO 2-phospho-L-lactate transferase
MSEQPVRTRVQTPAGWRGLQEFLILDHAEAPIVGVELEGIADARPTPEVLEALASAEAVIIGPSNPVISIGPILSVPGMREALAGAPGPVVAVSPLVGGRAVKGPTDAFLRSLGRPVSAAGVASLYVGLLDGMVIDAGDSDSAPGDLELLSCPTLMEGASGRRALAERVLEFARGL